MPNIGPFHPQLAHFVVALGLVGVVFRLVSLTGRLLWTRPAGAVLLLIAAVSSVASVKSGQEAHGPVERAPGAREAVQKHEELGEETRNLFLIVGVLELGAMALRRKEKAQKILYVLSGLAGIGASAVLYEAAEHGGELVYSYAGGIGLRTSDPADVQRLLIAGLYHEARLARDAGRKDEAARLTQELALQAPSDPSVQMLAIESMINDQGNPRGGLDALRAMPAPADNPRFVIQKGLLESEAYVQLGQADSARLILNDLARQFPTSRSVTDAQAKLK
ncbi:MAG: DUF2231 domain-containing protein [Gemmatimonadota bacterium]